MREKELGNLAYKETNFFLCAKKNLEKNQSLAYKETNFFLREKEFGKKSKFGV